MQKLIALMCLGWAAAACTSFDRTPLPGKTTGVIYVGTPRISGRERLVNDRRQQEEWLQAQLSGVDQAQFGINAGLDTRNLSILAAGLQAKTGPNVDAYRAQQEANVALIREQNASLIAAERVRREGVDQIASKVSSKEIDAKEAAAQLSALGVTTSTISTAASASAPSASGAGTSVAALGGGFIDNFKNGGALAPPSGASGALSTVTGSPIDLFRDRLALREEIRNEINENALDETHDLYNHSLYRLTFDATVLPDDDTSAYALVEVEIQGGSSRFSPSELRRSYLDFKTKDINETFARRVAQLDLYTDWCLKARPNDDSLLGLIRCASSKAFSVPLSQKFNIAAARMGSPRPAARKNIDPVELSAYLLNQIPGPERRSAPVPAAASSPSRDLGKLVIEVVDSVTRGEFEAAGLHCFFNLRRETPDGVAAYSLTLTKSLPDGCAAYSNEAFAKRIQGPFGEQTPRVYAVTPKETVQRISDVSSHRAATELLFGLSALAGVGDIEAMAQSVRENDVFMQAVRRQPLIVGYTKYGTKAEQAAAAGCDGGGNGSECPPGATFGWVLGPTFSIVRDSSRPAFRHTVKQQALTAGISVPSTWQEMTVKVTTTWRREVTAAEKSTTYSAQTYRIPLPFKMSSIDEALTRSGDRTPVVDEQYNVNVQVGQGARIILRGDNVWRSTEVYLGAQRADRIRLLPDMRGVVAEFDAVGSLWGTRRSDRAGDVVDISVATSEGSVTAGHATVVRPGGGNPSVVGFGRRILGDQPVGLSLSPPLVSFRTVTLQLHNATDAVADATVATTDNDGGMVVARDGTSAQATLKTDTLKQFQSGSSVDAFLVVSSDQALGPQTLVVVRGATYYDKSSSAQAVADWATKGSGVRAVRLKLPKRTAQAFATAGTGTLVVQATVKTKSDGDLNLEQRPCKVSASDCILNFTLGNAPKDIATAVKAGDFSLVLKFDGDDVPEINSNALAAK